MDTIINLILKYDNELSFDILKMIFTVNDSISLNHYSLSTILVHLHDYPEYKHFIRDDVVTFSDVIMENGIIYYVVNYKDTEYTYKDCYHNHLRMIHNYFSNTILPPNESDLISDITEELIHLRGYDIFTCLEFDNNHIDFFDRMLGELGYTYHNSNIEYKVNDGFEYINGDFSLKVIYDSDYILELNNGEKKTFKSDLEGRCLLIWNVMNIIKVTFDGGKCPLVRN